MCERVCVKFATSQFLMQGVSGGKSTHTYIYMYIYMCVCVC